MKPYYEHAGITIYHGDCSIIVPQLSRCDLLLTDPPYGIKESAGKNKSRTKPFGSRTAQGGSQIIATDYGNENWDNAPPEQWLMGLLLHKTKHQIIWGGNYFALPASSCWLVWDKLNSGDFADCELAWTNLKKAVRKFEWMWNGCLRQGREQRFHPTQKPLALMKWCIAQAPEECKSILDPFMGSGTALVAAKQAGVTAIGVDQSERYCELAAQRLQQEVFGFSEVA